jgi:PAS domain S-box-containing protein
MGNELTSEQVLGAAAPTAEERFHLLVEAVQDYAIYMLDLGGNIASWNAGAERIKGYKEAEILGQNFSVFLLKRTETEASPSSSSEWQHSMADSKTRAGACGRMERVFGRT